MPVKPENPEPDSEIFVSQSPLDFSGDTATFQQQVVREAQARAQRGMSRDMPHLSNARHSHSRVFDANRYSARTYLPETEGSGYWDLYRLSKNMFVMIADCEYRQAKWLGTPDPGFFKVRLLRTGELWTPEKSVLLDAPGGMLAIFPTHGESGYFISPGVCKLVILHCRLDSLTEELGLDAESIPPVLALPKDDSTALPAVARRLHMTPRLVNAMSDVLDSRDLYAPGLRGCFVEAKSREILASVVQSLVEKPELETEAGGLSRRERHRILDAQEIIRANLGDLPTIADLSKMVGINRTKLKSGFKAVVGCTIGDFTRQKQMEEAAHLLRSGEYAISEIGYSVGYRHPANFSYAFKRYYGCLPSEMRKRARHN
jgi:AraC-like DNA-binding protein